MKKQILIILFFNLFFFCFILNVSANNNLIETITDKKIMFIKDDNGKFVYSWTFDKNEYNKTGFEFELGINFTSKYKEKINALAGINIKKKYISFEYDGNLPVSSIVKVNVKDTFSEGKKLNLYHYDKNDNVIKLVKSNIKVINGNVSFEIKDCSEYFLTLEYLANFNKNVGNNGIVIIGMIIVIVGLIGYTLMKNK